jgi:cobalt/nickel transport system permease protein
MRVSNTSILPKYLTISAQQELPKARKTWWQRQDYLEKMLVDVHQVIVENLYQTDVRVRSSFLQSLEPRVKVLSALFLLVMSALTRDLFSLAVLQGVLLLVAWLSGLRLKSYLGRVWLPALGFSGVAVLPAIFSWITPGDAWFFIYHDLSLQVGNFILPRELAITQQGVTVAAFVLLRAVTSLGLVVLLMATTRWSMVTKALGKLGMPAILVMVLDMTYRYLFLFLLLLGDYILGRKSRVVGSERYRSALSWVGAALAGFLWLIVEYSKEVSAAMIARGYTGEIHSELAQPFSAREACFFSVVVILGVVLWGGERLVRIICV